MLCAPGNAGIEAHARPLPALDVSDAAAVAALCEAEGVRLVVVGPEAPLVEGLADGLRERGVPVFGPSKAASELEGSKEFMKARRARTQRAVPRGAPPPRGKHFRTSAPRGPRRPAAWGNHRGAARGLSRMRVGPHGRHPCGGPQTMLCASRPTASTTPFPPSVN